MSSKIALIGARAHRWTPWLAEHLGLKSLLVADPADTHFGCAARAVLARGEEVMAWRFVGCIDPKQQPLSLIRALTELCHEISGNSVILLPPFLPQPLNRQLLQTMISVIRPDELLIPAGEDVETEGWGIGPSAIELPDALPSVVQTAQRRGRWIEIQEGCELHEVRLDEVHILGARIGTGEPMRLPAEPLLDPIVYAEMAGKMLYLVAEQPLSEGAINRALQFAHAQRAHVVLQSDFEHLICCLERHNGEPICIGFIERAEFRKGRLVVRARITQGAPVRQIQLGTLQVDGEGRELEGIKPWSI